MHELVELVDIELARAVHVDLGELVHNTTDGLVGVDDLLLVALADHVEKLIKSAYLVEVDLVLEREAHETVVALQLLLARQQANGEEGLSKLLRSQ